METEALVFPFLDDVSGTIRGYRIFTACRMLRGKIFRIEDHLDRLYYSASSLSMMPPLQRGELRNLLVEIVNKNLEINLEEDFLIDIIFSGGLAGSTMKQSGTGAHLYIAVQGMERPAAELYERGAALATFFHQRMCPDVKLLNYVGAIIAHQTVVPMYRAYEVLFVCPLDRQTVLEGSTFTIFFVNSHGDIITPPLDGRILDSVTRKVIFEILSPRKDFRIKERTITLDMIPELREAFLASTTRNILPVTRINDEVIGDGKPGNVTKAATNVLDDYLNSY